MATRNPYAPPTTSPIAESARAPLPEGVHRYGLDPGALRALVTRTSLAAFARAVLAAVAWAVLLATQGPIGKDALLVLGPVMVLAPGVGGLLFFLRARSLARRALEGYELLVGPRTMRRTTYGLPPAELLAPEVASIVELRDGLSIVSREGGGLLVTRTLAGYAEVRAHVATWGPITPGGGVSGWLRKRAHRGRDRTRDRVFGTVLEHDDELLAELRSVRGSAMEPNEASVRWARWRRRLTIFAWVWILFMVWLWNFLAPPPKSATGTASPSTVHAP